MSTLAVMTAGMRSPLAATVAGLERPARRSGARRRFRMPTVPLVRRTPRSWLSPLYVAGLGHA